MPVRELKDGEEVVPLKTPKVRELRQDEEVVPLGGTPDNGWMSSIGAAVRPIASKIGENFSRSWNAPPPLLPIAKVPALDSTKVDDSQQQAAEAAAARASAAKTLGGGMTAASKRPKMTERQAAEAIVKNITPFPGVVDAITNPNSPARSDLGTLLNPFPNVVNSAFETGLDVVRGALGHNAAKLVEDAMMNYPALHTIPAPIMFTDLYKAARTPTPTVKPSLEPAPKPEPRLRPTETLRNDVRGMFADETGSALTTRPAPQVAPDVKPAVPRETVTAPDARLTAEQVVDKVASQQNPQFFDAKAVIDDVVKGGDTYIKAEVDPRTVSVPAETTVERGVSAPEKGPIVVGADGKVIDGRHRVVDARDAGEKSIEAYVPEARAPVEAAPRPTDTTRPLAELSMDELLAMVGEKSPESAPLQPAAPIVLESPKPGEPRIAPVAPKPIETESAGRLSAEIPAAQAEPKPAAADLGKVGDPVTVKGVDSVLADQRSINGAIEKDRTSVPQAAPVDDIQAKIAKLEVENAALAAKRKPAPEPKAGKNPKPAVLRRMADDMQAKIDVKLNPATANQNPTRRRAGIIEGMQKEGQKLIDAQAKLRAVADAIEAGTLPDSLKNISTRADIEELQSPRFYRSSVWAHAVEALLEATKGKRGLAEDRAAAQRFNGARNSNSNAIPLAPSDLDPLMRLANAAQDIKPYDAKNVREAVANARRRFKLGIDSEQAFNRAKADLETISKDAPRIDQRAQEIRAAENKLIGTKVAGRFFTPKELAKRVVEEADIQPGMKVLEPSAGKGDLIDVIKAAEPSADVSAVEIRSELRDILKLKEHKVVADDFLDYQDGGYDRIVMNPPFEGGLDGIHVQHAYDLLKPGGKLVSIMGEGTFFRNDAKAKAFREWADSVGGTSEKLPDKSFTGAGTITQTGTATRLFTVEKPMDVADGKGRGAVLPPELITPEADLSGASVTELIKKGLGTETGAIGNLTPEQAAAEAGARAARQEIYRRIQVEATKAGETVEAAAERLKISPALMAKMKADQAPPVMPTAEKAAPEPADGGFVTSIKNAQVDRELAELGKPPATHGERMTFEAARAEAAAIMAVDPFAGKKLVDEFTRNPRPPTPVEDALLLHEQTRLKNERLAAEDRLIAAQSAGDPVEIANAKANVDAVSADFMTVGDVVTRAGTESSLSLGHRRMMMKEDYSLAAMERAKQVENGGRPLTAAQRAEVKTLHEKITATQKAFDEYIAKAEAEKAELQSQIEHSKMVDKTETVVDPQIRSLAQRILASMDSQADAARVRLRAKMGRLSSGIDPTLISDAAIIGAAKLAHGIADFAKWSKAMIEDIGESISPHLQSIWDVSNARLNDRVEKMSGKSTEKVRRVIEGADVKDRIGVVKGQVAEKIKVGDDITFQAQELARTFVAQGITERNALIDAVHNQLVDVVPDITRRQTMDAISGYGRYHQLSRDQISSQLRDLKGQMQQVAKLEDIMNQNPPLKTGVERRIPSDEERHLIQQVNEAKRRYGIVTTDSETQLKSTLDARKTYYQNQISDLEAQINANEKFVKHKTPSPTDADLEALKTRRTELKQQFDEIFGKEGLSDEQRIQIATKATERSIEDLQRRIEAKDLAPRKRASVTPETPELQALRARRDALQDQLQELRDAANPKATPEERALKSLKTRLSNQTAEMYERIANGDFSKKPKVEIVPDAEAKRLQFENAKAKQQWNEALMKDRLANRTASEKIIGRIGEAANASRAVITSFDLSAVARQGGFISFGHPIMAAKAFPDMLRALRSERGQFEAQQAILARENYPLYKRAGLYLSEDKGTLAAMEEAYMSRWAQKIPGVAGSERAYTTFLNKLRADAFDTLSATLTRDGAPSVDEAKAIANYINVATGRGDLGMKANALVGLNTVFFAPRYAASRFQLLAGQPMYRGTARTRSLIAKEYARAIIGAGMVYGLGSLAGAEVETDPRSSDFGKLRFGNTRVDPLMGLSQVTTLLGREISGQTKSVKGRITDIRGDNVPYGGATSVDVLGRFLRTKLSPSVGAGVDIMAGKDVVGNPVTPESVVGGVTVPLVMRDIYEAMKDKGVPAGSALGLISIFGMGLQTFDPYQPRVKDRRSFTERMSERLGFDAGEAQ